MYFYGRAESRPCDLGEIVLAPVRSAAPALWLTAEFRSFISAIDGIKTLQSRMVLLVH
jgi:hypothetical protein